MLTDPLTLIIAIIVAAGALFFICMIACAVALGRMHAWLKENEELFGDTAGLQRELNAIRVRQRQV